MNIFLVDFCNHRTNERFVYEVSTNAGIKCAEDMARESLVGLVESYAYSEREANAIVGCFRVRTKWLRIEDCEEDVVPIQYSTTPYFESEDSE